MRQQRILGIAIALAATCQPAHACRTSAELVIADIAYADVVVVARIANYRIVRDQAFRERMLANPNITPEMRALYTGRNGLLPDYARFELQVSEVLSGKAPKRLTVTWDNSTFSEPEAMPPGPYLIALRKPGSAPPPLRGPSATIVPNQEPDTLTLLQAPCSHPFLFDSSSEEARAARVFLKSRPK